MAITHVVAQGEYLSLIAAQHGFRDWRVIWNHPDNAALKQLRKNPNVLLPGDRIAVPDRTVGVVAAATGTLTTFETGTNDVLLNITFEDTSAKPLASRPGQITVGGNDANGVQVKKGPIPMNTAADGKLPVVFKTLAGTLAASEGAFVFDAPAPPAAAPPPPVFRFLIGDLDPIDTPSGQRARLNNLGYFAGFSERDEDQLAWAAEEFQADEKLPVQGLTGDRAKDRQTLNRLGQRHGDMLKGEEL